MKTCLMLLLSAALGIMSCQSSRLSSKQRSQFVHARIDSVFIMSVAEGYAEKANHVRREVDLDSLQGLELLRIPLLYERVQQERDSVRLYSEQHMTKEEEHTLYDCIDRGENSSACQQILRPIAEYSINKVEVLAEEAEYTMAEAVLENNWLPSNTTPENCALLQSGSFYYFEPYSRTPIQVERDGGRQVEHTEGGNKSYYKVVWDDYNTYRLIEQQSGREREATFEVLQVYPTHYIFKCGIIGSNKNSRIGRMYRAEKKS